MNLRTLKKRSKRALPLLISHYGFRPSEIFMAGKDSNYHGLVIRCTHKRPHRCGCDMHPLKGTPMTGGMRGHEEPEWEEETLLEVLQDAVIWQDRPSTMTDIDWLNALRITGCTPANIDDLMAWGAASGDEVIPEAAQ